MDAIEQNFPLSDDFKPQPPSFSPSDLTLNRDPEESPPADDDKLKQILTLEFQNLAVKDAVDAGVINVAVEESEQMAVDEDGELKQAIGQELHRLVLKETINEFESNSEAALDGSNDWKGNDAVKEMDHEFGDSVKARVSGEIEDVDAVKEIEGFDGWNGGIKDGNKKRDELDGWNDDIKDGKMKRHELDGWNDGIEDGKMNRDEHDGWNSGIEEGQKERDELDGWNSGIEEGWNSGIEEGKLERDDFDGWNGGIEEGKRTKDGEESGYESVYHVGEDSSAVGATEDAKSSSYHYPVRPDAEDCSFYLRTGACKFGSNCKFNHPLKMKNQPFKLSLKQRDENSDKPGQTECKYYLSSGGCKYGKACKFSHSRGRPVAAPIAEFNFLGLPIRKGEKECPFYMRTGSCKYGSNCRFNHPDPTAGGGESPVGYGNGGSSSLPGPPQTTMSSWSPRALNEPAPYVPIRYSPPIQGIPSPNPEWNGYQAPVYPTSERCLPTPPAFALNNSASNTSLYTHHQQQMLVGDFPERPGQPECSYFLKTGDCKYRSSCKFHHPKIRITNTSQSVLSDKGLPLRPIRITNTSQSVLSDKGLPLRPDQNICTHYSRYGICKYGPSCKYDHPVNYLNPTFGGGSGPDGPRTGGSGMGRGLIQQSV